jgi:transcriptional regulator with XRE-family HTH domain
MKNATLIYKLSTIDRTVLNIDTMNSEIANVVAAVKRQLKAQGRTYRDVARALRLSEASVKRLFSSKRFTVDRLAQIAQFLGFSLAELVQAAAAAVPELDALTSAQEAQLICDEKLLLVAVLALNHWTLAEIVAWYRLSVADAVRRLRVLDRMGIIELLPGDRIRRRARRDFDWIADGPIKQYFARQGSSDFLNGKFNAEEETLDFLHGMLTPAAQTELRLELRRLRRKMASLHEESVPAPVQEKRDVGLLLAMRRWEPVGFRKLRRDADKPAGDELS